MSAGSISSWTVFCIRALAVLLCAGVFIYLFSEYTIVHAATYTWDGGDVDDQNWSSCDNWSTNVCPTSSDTVVFNGTSVEDSVVDAGFTGTVDAVQVNSGYTGIITLARDLTLDNSGGFSQSAGTFDISGFTLTLSASAGSLTVSGGTFLGANATTTFTGNSFASTQTLSCGGTHPGVINTTLSSTFTLASGCSATLASAISKTGRINLTGDATAQAGSTITLNNGFSAPGHLTITGSLAGLSGLATTSFIGNSFATGQTLTCTGTYPGVVNTTLESPFTLASGCNATLANTISKTGNITLAGDATALSGSTITLSGSANADGDLTVTGSLAGLSGLATTTFSASSFIISQTLTCTGTWPGILSPGSGEGPFTLASGCNATLANTISKTGNITLAGDATALSGSTITLSGSANADGDLTVTGSLAGLASLATTTFSSTNASRGQDLTCTGTWPGALSPGSGAAPFTLSAGCIATLGSNVSKAGTITINGSLNTLNFNTSASTLTVNSGGTLKLESGQTIFKTPVLNSGSTVEYTGASTYTTLMAGSTYSNLVISGSGSFATSTALTITDAFTQTAGSFTPSATTTFSGSSGATVTTTGGSNFSHVAVNKTGATVTLAGSGLVATGNLFITAGTLDVSASGCSSASCNITVGGSWSNSDTFTARTSTVTFNGSNQSLAGTTTFYNLTKSSGTTDTLAFPAGVTQTITNTLTLNGVASNLLSLRSSTDASQWSIDPQGTRTISYLDVKDSNNVNATVITANDGTSVNSLNNTNWSFFGPAVGTLGPAAVTGGASGDDTTPSFTFTTSDSDAGDTVRFQLQVATDASFTSLVIDYFSALAAQGTLSFSVGQAAGTGTYFTGSADQTLSDASYYWRVRASDGSATSSYSTANSGAVAFVVDTTVTSSSGGGSAAPSTPPGIDTGSTDTFPAPTTPTPPTPPAPPIGSPYQPPVPPGQEKKDPSTASSTPPAPPPPTSPFSSGLTTECYRAFSWSRTMGPLTITRIIGTGHETVVATPNPNAPWYVDVDPLTSTSLTYSFKQRGTGEVWKTATYTAADLAACAATLAPSAEVVEEDIDQDGNAEQYIDGVFQDTDGSTVPLATADGGILLDTDADGIPDTYWLPESESGASLTSPVIAASDRLYVVGGTLTGLHDFEPLAADSYNLSFEDQGAYVAIVLNAVEAIPLSAEAVLLPLVARMLTPALQFLGLGGAVAALVALSGSSAGLGSLFARFFSSVLAFFGLRKRGRPWGVVYDSVTKRPLDPAYVRLLDSQGQVVGERITDMDGRFGFLLAPGTYTMNATKTHYQFPSARSAGKAEDVLYNNLYMGGAFSIAEGEVMTKNIPMDPVGFDWNEFEKNKRNLFHFYKRRQAFIVRAGLVLYALGFVSALVSVYLIPSLTSGFIVVVYVLVTLVRLFWTPHHRAVSLTNALGAPYAFAIVRVYDPTLDTVVKTLVADHLGRVYLLLTPGTYRLTIEEPLPNGTYRPVYANNYPMPRGVIEEDLVVTGFLEQTPVLAEGVVAQGHTYP